MTIHIGVPIGRCLLAAIALAAFGAVPAGAQTAERLISNPRVLGEGIAPESLTPTARALPHERILDLNIVYTDGQIWNPATNRYDKVHLRSYNGTDVDPDTPYVSPTIEAVPGDTIRVNLDNQLPADPTCKPHTEPEHANTPHCFNGTNLHTHGLWVNPSGNGDNVLLSINPGVKFQYEYNIPSDHPAGTFWYHTHRHGSTALQVSSGMAGALIIRGNRLPTEKAHGDVDTLLKDFPERVMMFQQIQYGCLDGDGKIKREGTDGPYICDPGDTGVIESYDGFAPGQWGESGRYTSINGVVLPTFKTKEGEVERWRMIHGGVRDTITLQIVKMDETARLPANLSQAEAQAFIQQSCKPKAAGSDAGMLRIAADGLTTARTEPMGSLTFQPGYRWDALVVFPSAGRYCLVDEASSAAGSVNGDSLNPSLIGFVEVEPGTPTVSPYLTIQQALRTAAEAKMPADIKAQVIADIDNRSSLTLFAPHPDITDDELTGTQQLTFFIRIPPPPNPDKEPTLFEVSNTLDEADAVPYNPARLDRTLPLGGVDEWTIHSKLAGHPFHIHVNPFQVVSILDPQGRDVSSGAFDDAGGTRDYQYLQMKGLWKDTLWIKGPIAGGLYTIRIRTRYERYIGEFVLHCHILDHEDNGMMQNVAIVLPDGDISAAAATAPPLQLQQHTTHTKP